MKIINLTENSKLYTSNVFLVLGTWNAVPDLNTLIDVGSDENILAKIESINTGLGKRKIDQVIITHSHSDHAAILPLIKKKYAPKVYALNPFLPGVDVVLRDGDKLKIGDSECEVFNITAHSNDSICLFCEKENLLFTGDTKFPILFENHTMSEENSEVIKRLKKKTILKTFHGHGGERDFIYQSFQVI